MGLLSYVYRSSLGGDCTNGGISSGQIRGLCLVNVDGPFDPSDDFPPALLEIYRPFADQTRRFLRVVPAELEHGRWKPRGGWWMMGGNYCASSDSRFWEHVRGALELENFNGAIPIFDRREP